MKRLPGKATHFVLCITFCAVSVLWPKAHGSVRWNTTFGATFKSIVAHQSLRQTGLYAYKVCPFSEQRLRLYGSLSYDFFRIELANETSVFAQIVNSGLFPLDFAKESPAWETSVDLVDQPGLKIQSRMDRAFVEFSKEKLEITVGKQVIPTGVGHMFSAVNQVPGHPFTSVDREYAKTEDAFSVIWHGKSLLEGRFLPKVEGQQAHNFHFRAKNTFEGLDLAITGGRSDDKAYAGMEGALNLSESLLRGELVAYSYQQRAVFQGLVGIDHVFSSVWRGEVELFYNGFGKDSLEDYQILYQPHRSTPYLGKYYLGLATSWEISPILITSFHSVVNFVDRSSLLHFRIRYALADNIDLLVGQYLSIASHSRSEFGGQIPILFGTSLGIPDLTYFVLRLYF